MRRSDLANNQVSPTPPLPLAVLCFSQTGKASGILALSDDPICGIDKPHMDFYSYVMKPVMTLGTRSVISRIRDWSQHGLSSVVAESYCSD
jgi:hypothetical protein